MLLIDTVPQIAWQLKILEKWTANSVFVGNRKLIYLMNCRMKFILRQWVRENYHIFANSLEVMPMLLIFFPWLANPLSTVQYTNKQLLFDTDLFIHRVTYYRKLSVHDINYSLGPKQWKGASLRRPVYWFLWCCKTTYWKDGIIKMQYGRHGVHKAPWNMTPWLGGVWLACSNNVTEFIVYR